MRVEQRVTSGPQGTQVRTVYHCVRTVRSDLSHKADGPFNYNCYGSKVRQIVLCTRL